MLKICAFADEISPDIDEQIKGCKENGVTHIELRKVAGKIQVDFDKALRDEVKAKFADAGLTIGCLGTPIGKVKIDQPWQQHFDRFKIAVDLARFFETKLIRVFSYYPPDNGNILDHRDEVMRRFKDKVDYIGNDDITLVHENEARIFGEKCRDCLDLMKTINSPKLQSAFDFANFVQAGEKPLDNWPTLKPFTKHIHIKDAIMGSGKVVPAGQGDGQLAPILVDAYKSGYRGLVSLEPHLEAHLQYSGFSGPKLFKVAVDALKDVCRKNNIPLAGA